VQRAALAGARLGTKASAQVTLAFCTVAFVGKGNRRRVAGMVGPHQPVTRAIKFEVLLPDGVIHAGEHQIETHTGSRAARPPDLR
jgi:hypothetical protein